MTEEPGTPVGEACVDCAAFLANGTVPADRSELPDSIRKLWNGVQLTTSTRDDHNPENEDQWFSWKPCHCCGSPLGGLRECLLIIRA